MSLADIGPNLAYCSVCQVEYVFFICQVHVHIFRSATNYEQGITTYGKFCVPSFRMFTYKVEYLRHRGTARAIQTRTAAIMSTTELPMIFEILYLAKVKKYKSMRVWNTT